MLMCRYHLRASYGSADSGWAHAYSSGIFARKLYLLGARHGLALILAAEQYISSLRG